MTYTVLSIFFHRGWCCKLRPPKKGIRFIISELSVSLVFLKLSQAQADCSAWKWCHFHDRPNYPTIHPKSPRPTQMRLQFQVVLVWSQFGAVYVNPITLNFTSNCTVVVFKQWTEMSMVFWEQWNGWWPTASQLMRIMMMKSWFLTASPGLQTMVTWIPCTNEVKIVHWYPKIFKGSVGYDQISNLTTRTFPVDYVYHIYSTHSAERLNRHIPLNRFLTT